MATLRKRTVKVGRRAHSYWVVDFSAVQNSKPLRRQRNFKDKAAAQVFLAEIERELAQQVQPGPSWEGPPYRARCTMRCSRSSSPSISL